MTLAARIIRLEDRLTRPGPVEKIDWQPYLARLSDDQLERLEALSLKAGAEREENADRDMGELLVNLRPSEQREFYELLQVMGVPT